MDAARALADLVEISPQIEAAAVMGANGEIAGTVRVPEARADVLARSVQELLQGAGAFRGEESRVTQVHAELADGQVFAVRADERTIVAVTGGRAAPGLLFYDLKRCLAVVADEA